MLFNKEGNIVDHKKQNIIHHAIRANADSIFAVAHKDYLGFADSGGVTALMLSA